MASFRVSAYISGEAVFGEIIFGVTPFAGELESTPVEGIPADAVVLGAIAAALTADAIVLGAVGGSFQVAAIKFDDVPGTDGAFSASALLLATTAGSLTADAVPLATIGGSAALDAVILGTVAASFQVAAIKFDDIPGTDGAFSADAFILRTAVQSFVSDAVLFRAISGSLGLDAIVKAEVAGAFVADAVVLVVQQGQATVDAFLLREGVGSSTLDAVLFAGVEDSLEVQAILLRPQAGDLTNDAVITKGQVGSLTAEATIKSEVSGDYPLDAILFVTQSGALTADAWLETTVADSLTLDAVVIRPQTSAFTVDAIRLWLGPWSEVYENSVSDLNLTADAVILATLSASLTLDAVMAATGEDGFVGDAVLERTQVSNATLEAVVTDTFQQSFVSDAVIAREQSGSLSLDAVLLSTEAGQFTLDAALFGSQASSFQVAAIKFDDVPGTDGAFSADALLMREGVGQFVADAVLLAPISDSRTVDAWISLTGTGSLTLDAALLAETQAEVLADAVVLAAQEASFSVDAVLVAEQTGALTVDAITTASVDAALSADAVITGIVVGAFAVDGVVEAEGSGSFQADAVVFDDVAGSDGSFTLDAAIFDDVPGSDGSFSLDAVVTDTLQQSFVSDAVVTGEQSDFLSLDAVLLVSQSGQFSLDALLLVTQGASFAVDAFIQPYFTLDAVVGGNLFTLNAVIIDETPGSDGSFSIDAYLQYGFVDDIADIMFVQPAAPGQGKWIVTDVSAFTAAASDPSALNATAYSAWLGIEVTQAGILRILTDDVPDGMYDTQIYLFGPTDVAPIVSSVPFHYAEDNISGTYKASIHDFGSDALGTLYVGGNNSSTDAGHGIRLAPGKYWAVVVPYDDLGWDASEGPIRLWLETLPGFTIDALFQEKDTFWVDALFLVEQTGSLSVDAVFAPRRFTADAVLHIEVGDSLTVDAVFQEKDTFWVNAIIGDPQFTVEDIVWVRARITLPYTTPTDALTLDAVFADASLTADAFIVRPESFWAYAVVLGTIDSSLDVDAEIALGTPKRGWFRADAVRAKNIVAPFGVRFVLRAVIEERGFGVDAVFGTLSEGGGSFLLRSWLDYNEVTLEFSGETGIPMDAYIDSSWSETPFTIDATYVAPTRTGSFLMDADLAGGDEERGTTVLDAIRADIGSDVFVLSAEVAQNAPVTIDAWISDALPLDAVLLRAATSSLTVDAFISGRVDLDAVVIGTVAASTSVDAVIADASGSYWGVHLDALLMNTVTRDLEVLAKIVGGATSTFSVDAVIHPVFSLSAFVQPYFTLNAYLLSNSIIIYPPSQAGFDGVAVDADTFTAASGEFDPTLVGSVITIDGEDYTIAAVVDGQTLTLTPSSLPSGSTGLEWSIPSGSATDPIGNLPPLTREFELTIKWSRPDKNAFTDITGDVLWNRTSFTQSARVGPGTFELALLGTFPELIGGEEIIVEVDGYRIFGGYASAVSMDQAFEDESGTPITVLTGTDYNVMLDRLLIYNVNWDESHGDGVYRTWDPFPKGTSDRTIITTIANKYITDMRPRGFDFKTYVDTIESPAPTKGWQMESGTPFRMVMAEICKVTEGVFWIDPYKNLQYHDRSSTTAPFPITDGDSGVSARGLKIKSSLGIVSNDVFVWGTQSHEDTGDSDIIVSRQTADSDWDEEYWQSRIDRVQSKIDSIKAVPVFNRSVKQKTNLGAYKRALAVYRNKLAKAEADTSEGSVKRLGRLQYAEFRQDIYHQSSVNRRARAIMQRYSEPVIKAEATVFDPGFQAGQVASVVSVAHGVAEDIVIRQLTIDFVVVKETSGGKYFAVPRYKLSFGLDPEDPWNVVEYLPYPDGEPDDTPEDNPDPKEKTEEDTEKVTLDTFSRVWDSTYSLGPSTSERVEYRPWQRDTEAGVFTVEAVIL